MYLFAHETVVASSWILTFACFILTEGNNEESEEFNKKPVCQAGFYCSPKTLIPIPCPVGTYGPNPGVVFSNTCLACPPHHYCPRTALALPLPCGPAAQQPLSGQDTCVCLGEGQHFQASDAQCLCSLGYQPSNDNVCALKVYDLCHHGKSRTQHGQCLDRHQWSVHCERQVCPSAEAFGGVDRELGLCLCKELSERASCGPLCRRRVTEELNLDCKSNGELELVWRHENQVSSISGRVLQTLFLRWDPLETLQCSRKLNISRPVYIVRTTEEGFFGLLSGLPEELNHLFPITTQQETERFLESVLWEASQTGNISHTEVEMNVASSRGNWSQFKEIDRRPKGILNPTTCLHLGDVILFTVSPNHYPEYDIDNLYNTNPAFDWGAFRQLKEELSLSWTPPNLFSFVFNQPGVYAFKLSSHEHRHMFVRVMPADSQCYEPGPFFSSISRYLNRVGITQRRRLLLKPDWFVTGGLVFGAVIILGLCVTLLILFREYGWPEKKSIKVHYRLLHLAYNMDDYASKGSRVISFRKTHRNQHTRMTLSSAPNEPEGLEEFWDYEHQVDLEAFSSPTFYSLLLTQSLLVTSRLGQLTTEVKELYQGVTTKLQILQPSLITTEGRMGDSYDKIRREVEREEARRKSMGSQLRTVIEEQLQVLQREQQAQLRVHTVFTADLRECTRLLSQIYSNHQPIFEQNLIHRLTSIIERMEDLVTAECQRQGAWGFLGEGTGAKLLCPKTGNVLTKEHIFGTNGSLLVHQALHYDAVTGLIKPNAHSHLLLSSGHSVPVPPNHFVHPQTGRVMPIAGNVAYDPTSSTLVVTLDLCIGDSLKLDSPLIPFIPYPTHLHSGQPLSRIRLSGLRPGQRLQLGVPMADTDTGVPVPILGVTIHPETGLVYPLGGLHMCPITRQRQPIQIGCPMRESRTGNLVLIVGVSLDSVTGAVLPVGGILLSDFFVEPLSGRTLRVGGASIKAGQMVPHGGGFQTHLDCKVLAEMFKVLVLIKQLTDEWASEPVSLQMQMSRGSGRMENVPSVVKDMQQAWGRSLQSHLQLQTRMELMLDWAEALERDGGACGEMPLTGSNVGVPALVGLEYPDPGGSGLSVPVLGCECMPFSRKRRPLAGTMINPDGKGVEAIRYGSRTIDPATGIVAPVVGARLDISRKSVVPLTAPLWLSISEKTDSIAMEGLQKEVCARNTFWQQQKLKEEDVLSDLDSSLSLCVSNTQSYQWSVRPLREAAEELQESSQAEAQRRAAVCSHLALILPQHVHNTLIKGDEEEWLVHCAWQSALESAFNKLEVCLEQLQQEQERYTANENEWTMSHASLDRERLREVWEQCCAKQAELDSAANAVHVARSLSKLRADTAQAVLAGHFWYKEYGLVQFDGHRGAINVMSMVREKSLPLLERLSQLLQDKHYTGLSQNPCNNKLSDLQTKQSYGMEIASRVWTESVPAVVQVGNSSQSQRERVKAQSQDTGLEMSSGPSRPSQRHTLSSGLQSLESQTKKEQDISVPFISGEAWGRLLEQSPLFHLLKEVELQMKTWACGTGLVRGDHLEQGKPFVDVLDAQWECEGELIPIWASSLNPREYLVYQHGLFLMQTLNSQQLTPVVTLEITSSLPANNYVDNAFRNSFFYQILTSVSVYDQSQLKLCNSSTAGAHMEAEETLFVRRQRLQSVGGFSLLLLHCLCHISLSDMSSDGSPAFQRLFFKVLQAALGELFQARLNASPLGLDKGAHSRDIKGTLWKSPADSLQHSPGRSLLSQDVRELLRKHYETSVFTQVEEQLKHQIPLSKD